MELIKSSYEIIELNSDPLKHIEKIARTCYKSEDKITEDSSAKFVKKLYDKGHHAMLEFYPFYFLCDTDYADTLLRLNSSPDVNGDLMVYNKLSEPFTQVSCNFRTIIMISKYNGWLAGAAIDQYYYLKDYFDKIKYNFPANSNPCVLVPSERIEDFLKYLTVRIICDRGVTHELVRHRKCSFAQESTRYCNYGKQDHVKFIIPSQWNNIQEGVYNMASDADNFSDQNGEYGWFISLCYSENMYNKMLNQQCSPQQARSVLPNSLKTEIIVQARLSEWKHIFEQRCAKAAHPQMREIMIPLLKECQNRIPIIFDDIKVEY